MTVLQQHVPGYIQPLQLQIFLQSLAGFKLQQIIEVSDRQIKLCWAASGWTSKAPSWTAPSAAASPACAAASQQQHCNEYEALG